MALTAIYSVFHKMLTFKMHHPEFEPPADLHDTIISGAGPIGLFLACGLALAKCSVLILEKAADPQSPLKRLPFGIRGLSAPSIEALYRRGLLKELELHKRVKNPHQNAKQGAQGMCSTRQSQTQQTRCYRAHKIHAIIF